MPPGGLHENFKCRSIFRIDSKDKGNESQGERDLELAARGKPSTWLPRGGLVELAQKMLIRIGDRVEILHIPYVCRGVCSSLKQTSMHA